MVCEVLIIRSDSCRSHDLACEYVKVDLVAFLVVRQCWDNDHLNGSLNVAHGPQFGNSWTRVPMTGKSRLEPRLRGLSSKNMNIRCKRDQESVGHWNKVSQRERGLGMKLSEKEWGYRECEIVDEARRITELRGRITSRHPSSSRFNSFTHIWGESLENDGRYDDLFKCYEQALEVFADHEEVLNNLGAHLYRLGHLQEACLYFSQSQDVCSDFLPALKNLQSCCNLAVERWHYRMLNDNRRNQGFRSAITRAVGQGFNTVLDIGCGTGILSLFAMEAGAIEVFACDGSHSMVQLAAKVLEANNAADKVKLINKLSYDLKVPQDLPSRLSLIVTETLDAGLFGEHILQTVSHAWDSLLAPGGRVIPAGATLWVCATECPHLAARYQLKEDSTGLDWRGIHIYSAGEEQYDCEDLNSLPGGFSQSWRQYILADSEASKNCFKLHDSNSYSTAKSDLHQFLIEPVPALIVDFNDPEQLQQILSGNRNTTKICKVLKSGEVHVALAWFTLQLDAQEELSTCPIDERKAECWDQAVFPFVCVQYVRAGQYLELQVGYHGGKLSVSVHCCGSDVMKEKRLFKEDDNQPKMDSKDTNEESDNDIVFNNSLTIEPKSGSSNIDSKARTLNVSNQDKHKISLEIPPEMFNVSPEIGNVTKSDNISSIDAWEVLGLHLMKGIEKAKLWCISSEIKEVVLSVLDVNGVPAERIQFIKLEDGQENFSCSTFKFDLVVAHMFDLTGELSGSAIAMLPLIKKCLKEDGLILPQKITFQSMAVHSDWLERMSRVINNNVTCGYDIDRFINIYQVSHHLDFLFSSIPHNSYSCMMQLLSVNTGDIPSLEIGSTVSVPITRNGCVNALVYWFSVTYMEGILPISTLRNNSHIHQAAVLLHPGVPEGEGVESPVGRAEQQHAGAVERGECCELAG
uniref:Uncharacterized protein n=1 Tax=Timema cristinae TaxID=61476 RepID=A0A7R9C9R6_TIMCR|nr:unnamed protein product [Timema cristinae]